MEQLTISSINVDEMAEYMAGIVNNAIGNVEEISKTNPTVGFNLGRDSMNKLVLVASVTFEEDGTLSPMEYAERLIAADLIKTLVSNKLRPTK